jgi:hypothetical protein
MSATQGQCVSGRTQSSNDPSEAYCDERHLCGGHALRGGVASPCFHPGTHLYYWGVIGGSTVAEAATDGLSAALHRSRQRCTVRGVLLLLLRNCCCGEHVHEPCCCQPRARVVWLGVALLPMPGRVAHAAPSPLTFRVTVRMRVMTLQQLLLSRVSASPPDCARGHRLAALKPPPGCPAVTEPCCVGGQQPQPAVRPCVSAVQSRVQRKRVSTGRAGRGR